MLNFDLSYESSILLVGYGSRSSSTSLSDTWKATIILIPVRLGTESLNPIYIPCLKGKNPFLVSIVCL